MASQQNLPHLFLRTSSPPEHKQMAHLPHLQVTHLQVTHIHGKISADGTLAIPQRCRPHCTLTIPQRLRPQWRHNHPARMKRPVSIHRIVQGTLTILQLTRCWVFCSLSGKPTILHQMQLPRNQNSSNRPQ